MLQPFEIRRSFYETTATCRPGEFMKSGQKCTKPRQTSSFFLSKLRALSTEENAPSFGDCKGFSESTSQELRMLSSVTIDCQVTKIVMNPGSQLSVL